jgi:hypothetical protein
MYGISKSTGIRLFQKDTKFRDFAGIFNKDSSREEVVTSGENAIVLLYGGVVYEGLDMLRFRKFSNKVLNTSNHVQVHTLPPTSAAAMYHSLRVYLQTQIWLGNKTISPLEWGWKLNNGSLEPIKTDLPPAPETLLKIIKCNCKQNCDTKRCTCRKHGLECSSGCGACHGDSCSNSPSIDENDIDEEQDDVIPC